jgi:putative oxidoreductase
LNEDKAMFALLNRRPEPVDDMLLLAARILLSAIFIHEGLDLALHAEGAVAAMGRLGVPWPFALSTIALQLGAGLAIAIGWHTRLSALALGLFCIATAICFHTAFGRHDELLQFEKDLAIAGGMGMLFVRGAGRFSLDGYHVGQFMDRPYSLTAREREPSQVA